MAPRILGIVNLTRDSFSDGGAFLDPGRALDHARDLLADGAWGVDLGPASSHPDADHVSPEEELRRLEPMVDALLADGARVSIDSFQPATQRWALERGVAMLNDIQGFPGRELYPALAASDARLVVMHSIQRRGIATRESPDPEEVWDGLLEFFDRRVGALVGAGVAESRLILDPGMGFFLGAHPKTSLRVLRRLPELRRRYDLELLVSASRKSFLGALTGRPVAERGPATLAAELHAAARGADWIRTHDVRTLADALAVQEALEDGD